MTAKKPSDDEEDESEDSGMSFEDEYGFSYDSLTDVAVVPIFGPIFPHANLMTKYSGATSLDDTMNRIKDASGLNPSGIILNIDSPGGSVEGLTAFCSALALMTQRSGGSCPIIALANDLCASAAYMIASQCDSVYGVEGAMVGSIGTVMQMDNYDRAERNSGNDPILIRSHELKGIGYGSVTPSQMDDLARTVDLYFGKFKQAVSSGRPQVDLTKTATGQVWMVSPASGDTSAQELNLVDGVSTLDDLIESLKK